MTNPATHPLPATSTINAIGTNDTPIFSAFASQNGRSASATAASRDIISRIRTERVNIHDFDVTRAMEDGKAVRYIHLNGQHMEQVGNRFTTSLAGVLGTSLSNLSWIGYQEMVQKIHGVEGKEVNVTIIDGADGGPDQILAVIPTKRAEDALPGIAEMVKRLDPESIHYAGGRFFLNRSPESIQEFSIFGDSYIPSSWLVLPADNYGDVRRFLGTMRALCSNGMVLMDPHYEEVIKNSGDKFSSVMASLTHISDSMLETLRKRLTVADSTLISGKEVNNLLSSMMLDRRAYTKTQQYDEDTRERGNTEWFDRIIQLEEIMIKDGVGGMSGILKGDLDILGAVDCKVSVIDAINMFTEISTHYIGGPEGANGFALNGNLNKSIGQLLSKKRFNLEGSRIVSQRKDLWLAN